MDDRWTRIWWVRPVMSSSSSSVQTREPLADPVAGDGLPPVGHDGHPQPVAGVAPDGRLDAPDLGGHRAADQRQVALVDAARLELRLERDLGGIGAGDHEQAAGVPVETVDDARALDARRRCPGCRRPRRSCPAAR